MFLLFLLACGPSKRVDPEETEPPTPLDLDAALADAVADNDGRGGGVLRAEAPGGLRYLGAAGDETVDGDPMVEDDDFEIASVTKTFTATTVLLLMEDGELDLDDTLAERLPAYGQGLLVVDGEDLTGQITVRQLLQHTSGLPDYWSDPPYDRDGNNAFLGAFLADTDHFWTPDEILAYVPDLDPIGEPGATWHYSDTNYVLLGLIVEDLTGDALHDALRRRIFDPLGMDGTWMSFREDRGYPASHRYEARWDMTDKTHQSADWAGGGLVSTAADLSTFLLALAGGDVYASDSTLDEMRESVPTGEEDIAYGLGIFVVSLDGGGELWGHDGYGNAFMYLDTANGTVYTGTLNQTQNDWWPMIEDTL